MVRRRTRNSHHATRQRLRRMANVVPNTPAHPSAARPPHRRPIGASLLVDRDADAPGVADGRGGKVEVGVAVGVAVSVGVGVCVGVEVAVGVGVAVAVGVAVGVVVKVGVGVAVGRRVGLA